MRRSKLKEEERPPRKKKKELQKIKTKIPVNLLARFALDDELVDRFCRLLQKGLPPDGACDYLGILPGTFWSWVNKGQTYLSALAVASAAERAKMEATVTIERQCALFVARTRKALALYRVKLTRNLHAEDGDAKDWIRWIAILERRDRGTYSRNEPAGGTPEDYNADEKYL